MTEATHRNVFQEVGQPTVQPNVPQEIKRLRREHMDMCRRMGQPVIIRHLWGQDDVIAGLAKPCPADWDVAYDQVRNDCPICYGTGFVSVELSVDVDLYIDTNGNIVSGDPGTHVRAPRYGGFDQPYLTWLMEPDIAVDVFRINEQGLLTHQYDATGVAPWYPTMGDNDLCINVVLNNSDYTVQATNDRFQLKSVQQITMRGLGRPGRPLVNPVFLTSQTYKMSKIPSNNILQQVPVDVV